jgi:hypothetical protein
MTGSRQQEESAMDQERSGGISPTGIVLIVLACIGLGVLICAGVIVVCLVAITALGTSANKTFGTVAGRVGTMEVPPEQVAKQFVHDLGAGLTQAAWEQTSLEFQNRHIKAGGPDQSKYFADFLQDHPSLKNPVSLEVKSQMLDPSQPTVQATLTTQRGEKIIMNLKLKKEFGEWKINDVSVAEDDKKKGAGKERAAPRKNDKNE